MMSDNGNRYISGQEGSSQNELLDELGSLKDLLDEEIERSAAITSVNEISSVKEYMLLKQEADKAGLDLDSYLSQRATSASDLGDHEETIPVLEEVITEGATPKAEVPQAEPEPTIPAPQQAPEPPPTAYRDMPFNSLEQLEQLVDKIVQQKLDALKPQLEKQVFDEIRNMLPLDFVK